MTEKKTNVGKSLIAYLFRRWNPKLLINKEWMREKTHETFSKFFSNHWPFDEPLAGRTHSIRDPLYQVGYLSLSTLMCPSNLMQILRIHGF